MNAKKPNENYTTVCWYCGVVFRSNKSTARFCPGSGHRQLYDKYGPRINPIVVTEEGTYQNADECLFAAYRVSQNRRGPKTPPGSWDYGLDEAELVERFGYRGPLPEGDVLLVAGSYVLKEKEVLIGGASQYRIFLKPITALTIEERATALIISARAAEKAIGNTMDDEDGAVNSEPEERR